MTGDDELCEVCGDEPALPGLTKCLDCTNEALPDGFELPADTADRAWLDLEGEERDRA